MFAMVDYSEDFGGVSTVVAGVPGRQIRVRRWRFSSDVSGQAKLVSDPNGAGQTDLSARQYFAAGQVIDVGLSEREALAAETGKSLGLSVTLAGFSGDYSLCVWYDLI